MTNKINGIDVSEEIIIDGVKKRKKLNKIIVYKDYFFKAF